MEADLRIKQLVWDEWNLEHIAMHGVLPEDAEEVVSGRPLIRATYKGRFQLVGPTLSGRMLTVIVGPVPDTRDVYYVFSAHPASRRERRRYAREMEGLSS